MELKLKELRQAAGIRSQKEMAEMIGVTERRYASWERQEVMMNLEQAFNCCVVIGCTLNDLVGMKSDELTDSEAKLVDDYRATNSDWQDVISEQAANAAKEHPKTVSKSVERWTA